MHEKAHDILEAAVELAREAGLRHLTRDKVAERARVSGALVNRYYGTFDELVGRVVRVSVEREILPVIAQALVDKHPNVAHASPSLQARAAASILN